MQMYLIGAIVVAVVIVAALKYHASAKLEISDELQAIALSGRVSRGDVTQKFMTAMENTFGEWTHMNWFYANLPYAPQKSYGFHISQDLAGSSIPKERHRMRYLDVKAPRPSPPKKWNLRFGLSTPVPLESATFTVDGGVPALAQVIGRDLAGKKVRLDVGGINIFEADLTQQMLNARSDGDFIPSSEYDNRAVLGLMMYLTNRKAIDNEIGDLRAMLGVHHDQDRAEQNEYEAFSESLLRSAYKTGMREVSWIAPIQRLTSGQLNTAVIDKSRRLVFIRTGDDNQSIALDDITLSHDMRDPGSSTPAPVLLKRAENPVWSAALTPGHILSLGAALN